MVTVHDHHGVVHAARADMRPGECLCGWPPYGVEPRDPIGSWDLQARDVVTCPRCLEVMGAPL